MMLSLFDSYCELHACITIQAAAGSVAANCFILRTVRIRHKATGEVAIPETHANVPLWLLRSQSGARSGSLLANSDSAMIDCAPIPDAPKSECNPSDTALPFRYVAAECDCFARPFELKLVIFSTPEALSNEHAIGQISDRIRD